MMAKYRHSLPQLTSELPFLTEGGIETTLIYEKNIVLPHFATIMLLETPEGTEILRGFYDTYFQTALQNEIGIVLETRTWRGAPPWARKLGVSVEQLQNLNQLAVSLVLDFRKTKERISTPIVISGNVGPLSDAYIDGQGISAELAEEQYYEQIKTLVEAGVDLISAMTMTNMEEIKAIVSLAKRFKTPVHVSLNLEHNGRLLNQRRVEDTIRDLDKATDKYVAYFGINCAHPEHILSALKDMTPGIRERIGSIRGNASMKPHTELNETKVLDRGDIELYANSFENVFRLLPNLRVFGGCCGTDSEHLNAIARKIIVT